MTIAGLRDSAQFTVDGQRPKNFREGILHLFPNGMAPLTALSAAMKSESVDDPEFAWFEKSFQEQRLTLGADVSATETAGQTDILTLTGAGAYINVKKNHLLLLEKTNEVVRVTAKPTSNTDINVIRGVGMTAGATLTAIDHDAAGINPKVLVIGTAHPEGDMPPDSLSWDPVKQRNYTQIFRDKIGFTRTAQKTRLRTGDQVKEARREALEQHSVGIERSFIWGRSSEIADGGNGHPLRTTGGIVEVIAAAVAAGATEIQRDFGGDCTMYELEAGLEAAFRYGSNEKMAFCGSGALLALNQVIRKNTSYQFTAGEKEYGMSVVRFVTPFGTLVLKTHPLMNLMTAGSTLGTGYVSWGNSILVLDMHNLKYRYLKDSDTKYIPNVQANGLDGNESEYLTECGFEVNQARTHGLWLNLVRGIVDT